MKKQDFSWLRRYRTLLLSLSIVVVFITSYLLILPAITLEKDKAEEQGGISVTSESPVEETAQSDEADGTSMSVAGNEKSNPAKEAAETELVQKVEEAAKEVISTDDSASGDNAGKLSYEGEDYQIEIAYDEKAEIPERSKLEVEEISSDSEEYKNYLEDAAKELDTEKDNILFARFFDIKIISNEQEVEPNIPVQVKISYDDALDVHAAGGVKIVHFADEGVEVIDDIDINKKATEISYEQDSFSVTATVISGGSLPQPAANGTKYAVLIEHPETHELYAVENDGSLVKVTSYNPTTGKVDLDYPFEWTYISAHDAQSDDTLSTDGQTHPEWDPYNLRFTAEARQYNPGTQLPEGSYYRYISPVSTTGIDEETPESWHHGTSNGWHGYSLDGHKWTNGLKYQNQRLFDEHWDDNSSTNVSNGYYIGADWTNMHITGRQSEQNSAIVHMAVISEADIPVPASNNETVSHIDIAISGNGVLDVPLAYGTYYYKDANDNLVEAYTVSSGNDKTLHLEKSVPIDQNDIMKARIIATDYQGNEISNAYNVTGYTSNQTSPYSPVQVRVEGSFKVTTLPPYQAQGWWDRSNDNAQRRADRLKQENQIFYKVEMDKNVDFDIIDPTYGQLYDMHGNKLTTSIKMTLTDGFGYWDERNECPPVIESFEEDYPGLFDGENIQQIKGRNHRNWQDGCIIDNDWTSRPDIGRPSYKGDSGMDFILGNDAESNPDVLAVEVIKIIMDENGNRINPDHTIVNDFSLYYNEDKSQSNAGSAHSIHDLAVGPENAIPSEQLQSGGYYSGYNKLRDFSIDVNRDNSQSMNTGMGVYYDYQVGAGMYYIGEASASTQGDNQEITDVDGNHWVYEKTKVETEYVWRNNQHNGKKHYANGLSTVPEVLGSYVGDDFWSESKEFKTQEAAIAFRNMIVNDPNYREVGEIETITSASETRYKLSYETKQGNNGFLEFYVYNIYKPKTYPVYLKKVDVGNQSTGLAGAEFDLYGPYTSDRTTDDDNATTGRKQTKINTAPIVSTGGDDKIGDLSDGIYYLYETKSPAGYNRLTEPVKTVVDSKKEGSGQGSVVKYYQPINSAGQDSAVIDIDGGEGYQMTITNTPGVELPYTGGPGTWIYRIIGVLLIAGAGGWLLICRRRIA